MSTRAVKSRRGARRRRPYLCQRCGPDEAIALRKVGHVDVGAQIWKCPACGIMDRRLPGERRVLEAGALSADDHLVGLFLKGAEGAPRVPWVVGLEVLAILAIVIALLAVFGVLP